MIFMSMVPMRTIQQTPITIPRINHDPTMTIALGCVTESTKLHHEHLLMQLLFVYDM
jgi:hypothetical protein